MSAPGEDAVVDVYSRTHLYNRNVESYAMKIDRSNIHDLSITLSTWKKTSGKIPEHICEDYIFAHALTEIVLLQEFTNVKTEYFVEEVPVVVNDANTDLKACTIIKIVALTSMSMVDFHRSRHQQSSQRQTKTSAELGFRGFHGAIMDDASPFIENFFPK
ncbi:hypothetical protein OUZ56_020616 [Daphnia magna]|uniref:Uncharacterized protein n=1 Tax=Daphnia magna TaxID=35525 RepID=A0ABQ9ZGG2_9CRUS|nr:hypothetical protein OUZ56_020616 [Daphnia magna]